MGKNFAVVRKDVITNKWFIKTKLINKMAIFHDKRAFLISLIKTIIVLDIIRTIYLISICDPINNNS